MNILQIPDSLIGDSSCDLIQLFDYQTTTPNLKNKVVLSKNIFSFLIEGTKGIITDKESTNIDNQEFLIIGSGSCLMTENISNKNIYHSILFFFDDSALFDFCTKAEISKAKRETPQAYTICKYDNYIKQFVQSLIHIKQNSLDQQKGLLKAKFEEIMYYLLSKYGVDFVQSIMSFKDDKQKDFIRIVESNTLNNLTLQELSFLCHMSISTFKRNFKEQYQMSPIKWFQQKRLEHPAYLLHTKKRRPSDIYLEVGFESLSSFTQAFKQKYNITPGQFQTEE